MEWETLSSFNPDAWSEEEVFLMSDGSNIYVMRIAKHDFYFVGMTQENEYNILSRLTHWCMYQDMPLPSNSPDENMQEMINRWDRESLESDIRWDEYLAGKRNSPEK